MLYGSLCFADGKVEVGTNFLLCWSKKYSWLFIFPSRHDRHLEVFIMFFYFTNLIWDHTLQNSLNYIHVSNINLIVIDCLNVDSNYFQNFVVRFKTFLEHPALQCFMVYISLICFRLWMKLVSHKNYSWCIQ